MVKQLPEAINVQIEVYVDGLEQTCVDYILITNFCALIIIYSNLLYMFRASSAHLQGVYLYLAKVTGLFKNLRTF